MLIGTKDLNFEYIKQHQSEPDSIVNYALSLVPKWAVHIRGIVANQRYYVAVKVRNMLTIPYKTREAITNRLIEDISLYGMINDFVSLDELLSECNTEKLVEALRRNRNDTTQKI